MISRRLFDLTPLDMLPPKLRPATAITELSPADRVFGWVSQKAETDAAEPAYRSHVRVGAVRCVTEQPIEKFAQPKALAILGEPKPQQGRFYLGKVAGNYATAQSGAKKDEAGYHKGNRVRGPKVYPHHRRFDTATATTDTRDNQNRSVEGWVKPEVSLEFDLRVTNLSRFELGALVWLLRLPAEHVLRLGVGKPLGFGSVAAEIVADDTCIADGAAWGETNGRWDARPVAIDLAPLGAEFEGKMRAANPTLLPAFLRASGGVDGLPVYYPRLPTQQPGGGENFEWFVANDRESNRPGERGQKAALPDLSAVDCSLPSNPTS
jgi:hypothetical protein